MTYALTWRTKPMLIIFDLDGTLALTGHREHFLRRPYAEKDWRGFYAACDKDEPCAPIIRTALAFDAIGEQVEIWSGRSDEVAEKTTAWLQKHGLGHLTIRTRKSGDHRHDTVLKQEWMEELDRKPDLVFEDRARMVEMWRSHGIVCCQVAPGNF
ncbi:hypothetical protein [Consotaella aegiceratis]|uniref:phosphatase domain-containing protein n=1 Tax=Consotaella aegiceratis TaxID=3097961 RepID=UPI002F41BE60